MRKITIYQSKRFCFVLLLWSVLVPLNILAQNEYVIKGFVEDSASKSPLVGVTVTAGDSIGTVTNENGQYALAVEHTGQFIVKYNYIGYKEKTQVVDVTTLKVYEINVFLAEENFATGQTVVTAGRYQQDIDEVTVSMEIVKPDMIENMNPVNMEDVFNQVPGITINKQQANIRGGSGWSFGAGSRVLVLLDGLPLLSADAGDVKWNMLPVENIDQIEVIKGASSALYGSSALDGVVNIRTFSPRLKPHTKIMANYGFYGNPPEKKWKYWDKPPQFKRIQLLHARKIKNLGLTFSSNYYADDGYRMDEDNMKLRFNLNLEHRLPKNERFRYGLNTSFLLDTGGIFFYWQDTNNVYIPAKSTINRGVYKRLAIDPFIHYRDKQGNKHSVLSRMYITDNNNSTGQNSTATLYYGEYQFQKSLQTKKVEEIRITSGISGNYSLVKSPHLYGNHDSKNLAAFFQTDSKIKKLNLSLGGRLEGYTVDQLKWIWKPVFRGGLSYHLFQATHIRSSLGQGFRFPSVSERYTQTTTGSINIVPNPIIQPESGWSSEIGIRQGFKVNSFKGYADIAAFLTSYQDMIEFTFGIYQIIENGREKNVNGFKPMNIENTRVNGVDATTGGSFSTKDISVQYLLGYTFMNPVNADYTFNPVKDTLGTEKFLKYRNRHSAKANVQVKWKFLSFGSQFRYTSHMINIDPILNLVINGLYHFRQENDKGFVVWDANITADIHKETVQAGIYVKNVLNEAYMLFPGNIGAPVNISFLVRTSF